MKSGKHTTGAVVVDNIKLLQDKMAERVQEMSPNPDKLKDFLATFDAAGNFPFPTIVKKWQQQTDARFWDTIKKPFANLVLECQRQGVIFLGSTEEGNVWANYGQTGQAIVGKKAKVLDVWMRYTDAVIFLKRDANKAEPPKGEINPLQPKVRIQGLNPSWVMDWPSFITELEAAKQRREELIPDEAKVVQTLLVDEPEPQLVKE